MKRRRHYRHRIRRRRSKNHFHLGYLVVGVLVIALLVFASIGAFGTSSVHSTPTATPTVTPTPTLTPNGVSGGDGSTPTPTPIVSPVHSSTLPNSVLGSDYTQWGNFGVAEWQSQKQYFVQYGVNTVKLGLTLPHEPVTSLNTQGAGTVYSYSKLSAILDVFASWGVKAILCDQNSEAEQWFGSQAWVNDWKQVAADFKGDSRVASFEFAGEAYTWFLSPTGPTGGVTDMHSFDVACSYLIDQVRSIDPSRTIMYPIVVGLLTTSPSAFYNDLVSTGVSTKGNMQYDIVHPYYFEDYPNMDPVNDPVGDADWYWNVWVLPQVNYFGAANCFCGETFPWANGYKAGITVHWANQEAFEVAMINHFVSVGMGFTMWDYWGNPYQDGDCLKASNYMATIH